MSKKKKKLDKKLIAERLRELETEVQVAKPEKKVEFKPTFQKNEQELKEQKTEIKQNEADKLIVRDLKKVVILTAVIFLIFIALYFVNTKTNLILKTSDKIFNLLHVGQL